jgi:GNAT superfamily N-acetyltransferase
MLIKPSLLTSAETLSSKRETPPLLCKVIAISGSWYREWASLIFPGQDAVGRSVGRRLYEATEQAARGWCLGWIFTEASIIRPFFERWGFRVVREQTVSPRSVPITNFATEKDLPW